MCSGSNWMLRCPAVWPMSVYIYLPYPQGWKDGREGKTCSWRLAGTPKSTGWRGPGPTRPWEKERGKEAGFSHTRASVTREWGAIGPWEGPVNVMPREDQRSDVYHAETHSLSGWGRGKPPPTHRGLQPHPQRRRWPNAVEVSLLLVEAVGNRVTLSSPTSSISSPPLSGGTVKVGDRWAASQGSRHAAQLVWGVARRGTSLE